MRIPVVCVFEGGGAKGIAHVGTLAAVESLKQHLKVEGYAGTSAGAIVAALAAAGYSSNEIIGFDADKRQHILQKLKKCPAKSPTDLLGNGWFFIRFFRRLCRSSRFLVWMSVVTAVVLTTVMIAHLYDSNTFFGFKDINLNGFAWLTLYLVGGAMACFAALLYYFLNHFRGLASLKVMRDSLDELLALEAPKDENGRVTFRSLAKLEGGNLKIVAANITERRLTLFSKDDTPDVSVADAVAASSAIPFIFSPVKIDGELFCDGGIVCNLPAWTFDSDNLLRDVIVVTSELKEPQTVASDLADINSGSRRRRMASGDNQVKELVVSKRRGARLFNDIVRTGLFGASLLNTRGLIDHIAITLDSSKIDVLQFDAGFEKMMRVKISAADTSLAVIRHRFSEQAVARSLHREISKFLHPDENDQGNVRVALLRRVCMESAETTAGYRFWECQNFDRCPDQGATMSVAQEPVVSAFSEKRPFGLNLADDEGKARFVNGKSTQYDEEKASINGIKANSAKEKLNESSATFATQVLVSGQKWCACIPLERDMLRYTSAVWIDSDKTPESLENCVEEVAKLVTKVYDDAML